MAHSQTGTRLYMVAIGASAGGLEALLSLLPKMRATGYVTYVISQHMAQDAHSALMVELLNRVSPLPVTQALPDEKLLPDRIYLIPPGRNGVVKDGLIHLQPPLAHMLSTPSVDVLFNSIADNCKSRGVGVILSGTGSDGTSGCRAIRSHGGITFAQDPEAAVYNGMPSSAIAAGAIDHVFRESDLPEEILARLPGIRPSHPGEARFSRREDVHVEPALKKILQLVMQATGTDFSGYKEGTLQRRLEKRQASLKIPSVEGYLTHLRKHPDELANLQHAFLVSLSSFFRDHASFHALQRELHRLVERKKHGEDIRIWVPGCASGEEVYTLAIILTELLRERVHEFAISIVGTDLNAEAISHAEAGIYKKSAFKEMDPVLHERYFHSRGESWQIDRRLQDMCQFERGDVLRREPLQRLDLISCRNLLIYLKTDVQECLFQKFHDSLVPHGLLFLGQSESIGFSGKALFAPIDSYYRIFERY
jgi:chemotaxis methyl-accepting protein methylase